MKVTNRELNILRELGYTDNKMIRLYGRIKDKSYKTVTDVAGELLGSVGLAKKIIELTLLESVINESVA